MSSLRTNGRPLRTDRVSVRKLPRWKHADAGWFRDLDYQCFPKDTSFLNSHTYHWWVIRDSTGEPVAYAGLYVAVKNGVRTAHFTRCGVLSGSRGRGFQRRLIEARLRWCRLAGIKIVRTYTSLDNAPSIKNLRAAGFRGRRSGVWLYFRKDLP